MEAPMIWPEFLWDTELYKDETVPPTVYVNSLPPLPSLDVSSDDRQSTTSSSPSSSLSESNYQDKVLMKQRQISTAYSGPTVSDVANALSVTMGTSSFTHLSNSRMSVLEKGISKIENRYTLKMKNNGSGISDDGYKWRKYGQKSIKNSPNPRSYYKCANPRCGAKKQVEKSMEDPNTMIITYEGLHLHFAYPYFLHNQTQQGNLQIHKKAKRSFSANQFQEDETNKFTKNATSAGGLGIAQETSICNLHRQGSINGLLEDVVPELVRNPPNDAHIN